ncbi:MAG: hypothetical protein O3C57_00555 [Verrucomicrobia bacterium]|nr:hypothetical protein [Verrucomicrobiota bacterium]
MYIRTALKRVRVSSLFILCFATTGYAGTITGKVVYKGEPRPQREVKMSADPACLTSHNGAILDEKFVCGEAQGDVYPLANVFVYVKTGAPDVPAGVPAEPVMIDQKGCTFVPHVVGIRVGQTLQFKNSDKTMHNVHSLAKGSPAFNRGMPAGSPNISCTFSKPEIMVKLKCDVHPWMSVFVGVVDHPFFAVTGKDGQFTLDDLPDGEYEVETWQELLGSRNARVTVTAGVGTVELLYERQ